MTSHQRNFSVEVTKLNASFSVQHKGLLNDQSSKEYNKAPYMLQSVNERIVEVNFVEKITTNKNKHFGQMALEVSKS